jgi:phage baseplate assembly protein W
MKDYLKIPLTFKTSSREELLEKVSIEESIKQLIDLLIVTKQGECVYNQDFGYEIWTNEFEPILNVQQWQPKFIEQIKYMLKKYEPRITAIQVWEPEIRMVNKRSKADRDYKITLSLDYTIKQTGERQNDIKISFEY